MRFLNFISYFQFFEALEYKITMQLYSYNIDDILKSSPNMTLEIHDLQVKLQFLKYIERELKQFFLDSDF